jgi:hypothetical protein
MRRVRPYDGCMDYHENGTYILAYLFDGYVD